MPVAMGAEQRSPLRFLAPLALAAFFLLLLVVIVTSDVAEDNPGETRERAAEREAALGRAEDRDRRRRRGEAEEARLPRNRYTVQSGDTLGSIAERTGIPVETLQELNPEVDPQALVSGQQIRLRE